MRNLSDNELDDVFRRASKRYPSSVDSSTDWQEMAQRLDASDKVSGIRKGLTLVLIGSFIMLSLFKDSTTLDGTDYASILREQPKNEINLTDSNPVVSTGTRGVGNIVTPIPKKDFFRSHSNQKDSKEIYSRILVSENAVVPVNSEELSDEVFQRSVDVIEQSDLKDVSDETQIETALENTESSSDEFVDVSISQDPFLKSNQRFGLKVSISPDFSSIGYSSTDKPGWNNGVLLEYHLGSHWSLSTGIIRSRKIYSTSGIEYYGYKSDDVQGDCRIWDIPINVYYNFTPNGKWSFFSGIGISSYLMDKENYVYTINTYYGPKQYELEVEGKNKEWFKMLNLSVGLQRQLSNSFAIQVEPFLKAPLAGVGEGDVSLASLGAFISLKYKFTNKPK